MVEPIPMHNTHPLKHVALIMDGNNRWAKERGLSGIAGHEAGVERIRDILVTAKENGIEALTLFAFSSENWNRPDLEVRGLMSLFSTYLKKETKALRDDGVCLKVIGNRGEFSDRLKRIICDAETATANGKLTLYLCVDYGGRWDVTNTAKQLALEVQTGRLRPADISEELFDKYMQKDGIPDPDLCIRTAGDKRLSNFLLWQLAYTELYFTESYWPDFDGNALNVAIDEYHHRQRRFGMRSSEKALEAKCDQAGDSGHV